MVNLLLSRWQVLSIERRVFCTVTVALIAIGANPSFGQREEWVPVFVGQKTGQKFTYPFSNLDRIGIDVRRAVSDADVDLFVQLKKRPDATTTIALVRVPTTSIVSGTTHWFRFRPVGDDEIPIYYLSVGSTAPSVASAPTVRIVYGSVPWCDGTRDSSGVSRAGTLAISLDTERSMWTRISNVLARFEIDKPWFYSRYFYGALFIIYGLLVVEFLRVTYGLLRRISDPSPPIVSWRGFVFLLLGLGLVRGVLYSSLFPAWQAPDEPVHFATSLYFAEHGRRPPIETAIDRRVLESMDRADYALILRGGRPRPDWQTWIEDPRSEQVGDRRAWLNSPGLSFMAHPILSFFLRPTRGSDVETRLYLARLCVVMLTFALATLSWAIARRTWPNEPVYAVLVPACFTFFPMMTYMSSFVTYDALINVACTIVIFIVFRGLHHPWRWQDTIAVGLCLGLALLIKGMTLLLLPGLCCICGFMIYRSKQRGSMARRLAVSALIAGCAGGWWYAGNVYESGAILPGAGGLPGGGSLNPAWSHGEMNVDLGMGTPGQFGRLRPTPLPIAIVKTPVNAVRGMLGNFGWGNAPIPETLYWISGLIILMAGAGIVIRVCRVIFSKTPILARLSDGIGWHGALTLCYGGLLMFAQGRSVLGRYFFPVLVPMLCLFVYGLMTFIPPRYRFHGGWLLIAGVVLYDTTILVETIIPRYYLIPPPSRLLPFIN